MGRVITNPTGSVVDASEVKILYESNENTNAYTDGDKASLGEVKDAIDMAKKVIEITFLLNNWTSNSDGTYSQTVNNSEIKSSMNPDLISMLSSGATPEEQKTYMKNFSILCQGVGNTANGSVTYKIYKQMIGDITVGLTRLGGVKQIESGAKVDDVKVGGVSVVANKIAEIPEIPSTENFVPYSGATKLVDLGNHRLSASRISVSDDTNYISVGPTGISTSGNNIGFTAPHGKFAQLSIGDPTSDEQAATKKYVDNKVAEVSGKEIKTALVSETLNHLAPGSPWAEFDFNQGDFMGIPFNDLLGYNVWALYESTPQGFSIATTAEIKTVPLQEDNGKFSGLRVAYKSTKSTADTYTVFAIITYRK